MVGRESHLSAEEIAERATAGLYEALRATRRYKEIIEATPDLVLLFSPEGYVIDANGSAREVTGVAADVMLRDVMISGLIGSSTQELWSDVAADVADVASGAASWSGELALRRADGQEVPVWAVVLRHMADAGHLDYLSLIARDLTERKAYEAELRHRVYYDDLTGLPSQTSFLERAHQVLARGDRRGASAAVIVVNLDELRVVNQTLGREAGDRLLVAVADRLNVVSADQAHLARVGDGTFAALVDGRPAPVVRGLADDLLDALRRPFMVEGRQLVVTASAGVAFSRGERNRAEVLLRDAEAALAQAQERGGDSVVLFDDAMRIRAVERLELEHELRRAVQAGELRVAYQCEVTLDDGAVRGFEALVRWQHPTRGVISPLSFIPIAEDTGLIVPLGVHVLERACRQARRWHDARPDRAPLFVSVNLSPRQLVRPDLVASVARVLEQTEVDASAIQLELTESVFASHDERTLGVLHDLRALGLRLVVDDFGAGYSSLRYVKHFPIDVVKIDRAFVTDLVDDAQDRAIVQAVIAMAHGMGKVVVAEGVETAAQAEVLVDMGCDIAQGFFFGRPVWAADVELPR